MELTLCPARERFGVDGLLVFGVVGRLESGVADLLVTDPERKRGNRRGETVLLSDSCQYIQ